MNQAEKAAFLSRIARNPEIAVGLLEAVKAAELRHRGHNSTIGPQLRAAIAMAECDHVPRRVVEFVGADDTEGGAA